MQILLSSIRHLVSRPRSIALGGLAALALLGGSIAGQAAELDKQLAQAVPAGTSLVIAEQSDQASVPWNLSGVGDDAPYQVQFANFNGGPAVLEALISGAADVGFVGEAPLPIALSAGVDDLVAIGFRANPGSPENYYLVARPGSGVETVADLKGRSVAYPPGTGRHMILAGILHENGLALGQDVNGIAVNGTEVVPTFASGSVDAAIVLGHQYFRVGEPPILDDGAGHNWGANLIVVRKDALADPAKLAAIADFYRRAVYTFNWQGKNRDAWIEASYVAKQGLTAEQGRWLEDQAGHGAYYPLDSRAIDVLQEISDGLHETGALRKTIEIAPHLDARFNEILSWQNAQDGVTPRPLLQPDATGSTTR